jgi:heme a synthase
VTEENEQHEGRTLAISFAITVSMWAVAYVAMLGPGLFVGDALFGVVLALLVAGGFFTAKFGSLANQSWMWSCAKVGLAVASLNLLIVGSMLVDPDTHKLHRHALAWIGGNYVASVMLSLLGGFIFNMTARFVKLAGEQIQSHKWWNVFTIVAAVAVFLLLITGGIVTGTEAGMAVPDWPNSFGHNMLLYPVSEMVGGIYYEHAHRLYGMLVGVTAITMLVASFVLDRRAWLRTVAAVMLLMVCVQGVLGGTRVTETSRTLAITHGVFAQVVFALAASIAAFTSTTWRTAVVDESKGASTDRKLATVLPMLLIVQLALGALYRHLRREWNTPPEPLHPLFTHMAVALLVTILIIVVGGRAWGTYRSKPVLPVAGGILLVLVAGQLMLGTAATIAVWSRTGEQATPVLEVIITTAHQATGALMLATAVLIMIWMRRLLPARSQAQS